VSGVGQSEPSTRLRILVADDHMIVRDGLRLLIATQPDLELIAEARDGQEALELSRALRPNLILMDLRMPQLDGTAVIRSLMLEQPSMKILVMSSSDDASDIAAALRAGARGYLTKGAHHLEVLLAIRTVGQGARSSGRRSRGRCWIRSSPRRGPRRQFRRVKRFML
jgi:DNA-binding NarL/FixJ family response regulator